MKTPTRRTIDTFITEYFDTLECEERERIVGDAGLYITRVDDDQEECYYYFMGKIHQSPLDKPVTLHEGEYSNAMDGRERPFVRDKPEDTQSQGIKPLMNNRGNSVKNSDKTPDTHTSEDYT